MENFTALQKLSVEYYMQISYHSTLSLRIWEGPMAPESLGAPKSLVQPYNHTDSMFDNFNASKNLRSHKYIDTVHTGRKGNAMGGN